MRIRPVLPATARACGLAAYKRAYYHGCDCEGGQAPTDRELGLQKGLTPGAEEVTVLHGNLGSFEEAAVKTLRKSSGLRLSASTIESACKNVINARLDGPGMRWSEHGTDELAHTRALFKSESTAWDDYWSRRPAVAA